MPFASNTTDVRCQHIYVESTGIGGNPGIAFSKTDVISEMSTTDHIHVRDFLHFNATTHGGRGDESPDGSGDEFSRLKKRGGADYSEGHRRIYLTIITLLGGQDTLRKAVVLEVGAGIGWGLQQMLRDMQVEKYVGFEPCVRCIEHIENLVIKPWKRKQLELKQRLSPKKQVAFHLPSIQLFGEYFTSIEDAKVANALSGKADFTICIEVAEHVDPSIRLDFLRKLRKHTNLALFLSTPNKSTRPKDGALHDYQWLELIRLAGFPNVVSIEWQWTTLFVCQ